MFRRRYLEDKECHVPLVYPPSPKILRRCQKRRFTAIHLLQRLPVRRHLSALVPRLIHRLRSSITQRCFPSKRRRRGHGPWLTDHVDLLFSDRTAGVGLCPVADRSQDCIQYKDLGLIGGEPAKCLTPGFRIVGMYVTGGFEISEGN